MLKETTGAFDGARTLGWQVSKDQKSDALPTAPRRVEWNSDTLSGVWREIHQPYIKLKKVTYLSSILPLNKVYGTLTKQRIAVLKVTLLLSLFRFKASMVLLRSTYSR